VIDGRSDVYSLGCVLYEMMTGSQPYTGTSGRAIVLRHLTAPVPRPSAARKELPVDIDSLVMRAMAKDPADRFASGGEFVRALDAVLRGGRTSGAVQRYDPPEVTPPASRFVAVLPFET